MSEGRRLRHTLLYDPAQNEREEATFLPVVELTLPDLTVTFTSCLGIQPRQFVSLGLAGG